MLKKNISRNVGITSHNTNYKDKGYEGVPKFPPLGKVGTGSASIGIQGAALKVPNGKDPTESLPSTAKSVHSPPSSNRSLIEPQSQSSKVKQVDVTLRKENEQLKKELNETLTKEGAMKHELAALQSELKNLKKDLGIKDTEIINLKNELSKSQANALKDKQNETTIKQSEEKYKNLYETELSSHKITTKKLYETTEKLFTVQKASEEARVQHKIEFKKLESEHEHKLATLEATKNEELKTLQDKISFLKKQIADSLQGNSWERQQQLDELTKELSRVQGESEMLHARITALQRSSKVQGSCPTCGTPSKKS